LHSMRWRARYARLSQQTIRAKWQAARKVDIHGVDVTPPSGDLADAQWMRNNLQRAKMALPNDWWARETFSCCLGGRVAAVGEIDYH
jgi:hypothetical protein